MKRKSRELSIFSMSALDLFASALGAFILISVVMFPYFPNTGTADQRDLEAALERLQQEEMDNATLQGVLSEIREDLERRLEAVRAAAQREVDAARREAEEARRQTAGVQQELAETQEALAERGDRERGLEVALERERRRKFLLVTISWQGEDDVDLHIVDPRGNEYFYSARSHPGSAARFEEDTTRGPGNEVWLHPQVTPGEYRIYYNLFAQRGGAVTVRGSVVHAVDRDELPARTLSQQGDKPLVATVVVDADANVEVRQ